MSRSSGTGFSVRTRTSITSTIMPALSWLTVEAAVTAADPGGAPFDVEALLVGHGTVFLLGGDVTSVSGVSVSHFLTFVYSG